MSETSKCNRCGAPLPPDSPEGLCPRCLIALNLATQTEIPGETGPTKPPPAPPLPVADVAKLFPQLEILECLGRGGMGAVYKARQPRLDRVVALKILSPEKQGNQKFAERFEREARALAKLHHPNIVTVYDFGEVQGNFYLLMEFVDGLTLRQLLHTRKLSPEEALAIVPKICEALQYAHEQGIVHRDIKPENILMDKGGSIKIADFGIAKILGDGGRSNLTEEQAIGTPHYMSPEQIEKPQSVDHRADIYSLGVVFYEMLTGELPLGKFQPPSKKVHVDVRLDEIVLRTLEKEPERRYQRASEVKTQVETVAATPGRSRGDETQTENQTPIASLPTAQKPDHFWRKFAVIVIALIAIPFVLAIIGFFAAIAIPAFVHGRQHALEMRQQETASPSFNIGQTWFPEGDFIEITSVERTENRMVINGNYNLVSHDNASLALYITSTNSTGFSESAGQSINISKGSGVFMLMHPGAVPGLPHVSMYADNHTFASIYFGNQEEAAEESKADWITNTAWALAETWSPTLAPGEKPDLQKILQEAKDLMNQGKYEESLQRHIWYFNHALEYPDQGQSGVRLSFALSDWVELGRRYPKAKEALVEIRNNDTQKILSGLGYFQLFMEVQYINQYLGDDDATYKLFKSIEKSDPQLASQCFFSAEGILVQNGDYTTCRKYVGDPQGSFLSMSNMYQMDMQNQRRWVEFDRENKQRTEDFNRRFGRTNMPAYSPPSMSESIKKSGEDRFVGQVCQLIEILVATGSKSDAESIQTQALAVFDDPRLKSAMNDAESRIKEHREHSNAKEAGTTWTTNSSSVSTNHPQVISVSPPDGATGVDPRQTIRIRFDQPMNPNDLSLMCSGGFLSYGQIRYEPSRNEFDIPLQLLPGKTNNLTASWAEQGFRNTNSIPADEFHWQFTTKPFEPKPGSPKPVVVKILPAAGETMSVLTMLEITFDQPMTFDYGFPYLRDRGASFDLPGIVPDLSYDSSGQSVTIPLTLPPDNETKLTLEGFYTAGGIASDPVVVRCEIGTNNYSDQQRKYISTAAKDPKLEQLLSSMKAARLRLKSGVETVKWTTLSSQEKGAFNGITMYSAAFKWQGTNQVYGDISEVMNTTKAFVLGSDGETCWLYGDDNYNGRRLDSIPVSSVADIDVSIADPFGLTHNSIQSAIEKGKLVYEGQTHLDGHLCYQITSWFVEQTGNDYFPVSVSRYEWWVDAKTYLPIQNIQCASFGRQIFKFSYEALNQPLPAAAFQPPSAQGTKSDDWFDKKLGQDEKRFFTIKDGAGGNMVGQIGRKGPNGSTDSGLN